MLSNFKLSKEWITKSTIKQALKDFCLTFTLIDGYFVKLKEAESSFIAMISCLLLPISKTYEQTEYTQQQKPEQIKKDNLLF